MAPTRRMKRLARREFSGSDAVSLAENAVARSRAASSVARIVGIAASSRALDALSIFFDQMPAATGLTFVVALQVDPASENVAPDLLLKSTTLHVEQARDGQVVQPDHAYIIPPRRRLTLDHGLIRVTDTFEPRGTVEHFFRSLADTQRERAIGVILAGTGVDGTLALKAIKAKGGLAIVQSGDTLPPDNVPRGIITTGPADFVLPPGQMPMAILNHVQISQDHSVTSAASRVAAAGSAPPWPSRAVNAWCRSTRPCPQTARSADAWP